jgi:hypothetical protein
VYFDFVHCKIKSKAKDGEKREPEDENETE